MKIVLEKGAYKPYKAHPEDAGFDLFVLTAAQKWTEVTTMRDIEFCGKRIDNGEWVEKYMDLISKCTWEDTLLGERAIVRYCDGMFYVEYIESGDKFTLSAMKGHMKIVGNIYDNPELLGGNNNVTGEEMWQVWQPICVSYTR